MHVVLVSSPDLTNQCLGSFCAVANDGQKTHLFRNTIFVLKKKMIVLLGLIFQIRYNVQIYRHSLKRLSQRTEKRYKNYKSNFSIPISLLLYSVMGGRLHL